VSNRQKKIIKALSVVSKQRSMELEIAKSDAKRANQIVQDAENNINLVKSDVLGLEESVRDTCSSGAGFSVQDLVMYRDYLNAKKHDLEQAKLNRKLAVKARDEVVENLQNVNRQLELVDRAKENKQKQLQATLQKYAALVNDELCTKYKRT